eukprot:3773650-Rhodomonas_salina.4
MSGTALAHRATRVLRGVRYADTRAVSTRGTDSACAWYQLIVITSVVIYLTVLYDQLPILAKSLVTLMRILRFL